MAKAETKKEEALPQLSKALSPDMSKIFNPLCKKPSDISSGSSSCSSSTSIENSNSRGSQRIYERAQSLATEFQGECLSNNFSICKGKTSIKFRCINQHIFFIPTESFESASSLQESNLWCYKCQKFYEQCKEVAAQNSLEVVDGLFTEKITLRCLARAHCFKITYSKKLNCLSCADCRKEEREEWKEQLRQEEMRRNEIYTRQQQELFNKARQEMEYAAPSYSNSYPNQQYYYWQQQHQATGNGAFSSSDSWRSAPFSSHHFGGASGTATNISGGNYYAMIEE